MKKVISKFAKTYRMLVRRFGKRTSRVIFGFAIFLILVIVNCFIFFSEAIKSDDTGIVVVIDPGHGGMDPGKVGVSGVLEKDVNLAIALKLRDKLEAEGVRVVITRDNDECLATPGATNKKSSDMKNRIEIINGADADCLISIHQNSFIDSSVKGAQVFYYGTSKESRELAVKLQKLLISEVDPENRREAKEGNDYYILRKSTCPGVIIECGFLSCHEETARLVDNEYQCRIADAVAKAVISIYGK